MTKVPIDPAILAALDEERGAMAASGRNYRSLRLKAGESALARFLPVQMGPLKTWYARIARHWVLNRPVLCQRQTSPHFGGDEKVVCPLCDLEAEFSQSPHKATQELARRMGAYPKILTYLFVFELTDDRGRRLPTPQNEVYVPNEYWFTRDGWKEMDHLWRRSLERNPPHGFLDPVDGYDFTISRDRRNGYRHIREDPAPIDKNKSVDEMLTIIDKAFAKVKQPDTAPLSDEDMDATVEKAREALEGAAGGSRSSSRGRSEVDRNDEPEPEPRGRGRREEAAPERGRGRSDVPETDRELPARDAEGEPTPRRASTTPSREPSREPSRNLPARESRTEPARAETSSRRSQAEAPARQAGIDEGELDAAEPNEAEPQGGAERASVDDDPPPPVRGGGTATPTRRAAPPPPARSAARIDDDPETLPRERHDPAPPVSANPEGAAPARGAPADNQRKLSDKMQNNLRRLGGSQL